MTDYFSALRLREIVFADLVSAIETAIGSGDAALSISPSTGFAAVEVSQKAREGEGYTQLLNLPADWSVEAFWMDQLLAYSFAGAPNQIISSWADGSGEKLGNTAIARSAYLVENAPSLGALWQAKMRSAYPVLTDLQYEIVQTAHIGSMSEGELGEFPGWPQSRRVTAGRKAVVTVNTVEGPSFGGQYRVEAARATEFVVWEGDLVALIAELQRALRLLRRPRTNPPTS